jgi:HAD superfamily hydrolase (TIGR01509 family)
MDGTLVDTEPYWIECEHRLVAEHGEHWTDADAHSVVGFDLLDTASMLQERGGVRLERRAIVEWLLDGVIEMVERRLPWRPGAADLLTSCRDQGIPCVLVTMSWRRLAERVVASSPPGAFVGAVTGDEVTDGKPHPEPYLRAAGIVGADPSSCVAIEDSPTGVASALAAGCATLGVPHVVALAATPGLTIVESLVGVTVADLARLGARGPAASVERQRDRRP